jgi:hypothetical protein
MEVELVDNGDEERGRRLRGPTSKGKAYNVQRKRRTCIQTKNLYSFELRSDEDNEANKLDKLSSLILVAMIVAILLSKSWMYLSP